MTAPTPVPEIPQMTERHAKYLAEAKSLAWHAGDESDSPPCALPSCEHLSEVLALVRSLSEGTLRTLDDEILVALTKLWQTKLLANARKRRFERKQAHPLLVGEPKP